VTITNCTFIALPPSETNPNQYAIYQYRPTQVNIQHNRFLRGHNIFIDGNDVESISPIDISYNDFMDTSYYSQESELVGSVHGSAINATGGASIMWNRTTNHHGVSISEDVMSFTGSNGTSANPIYFAHNLVNGSYPDYTGDGSTATGSGFNNGDLGGSYITCQYNTAVRYTNNGEMTPAGTNITIDSCTAITTGYADDGQQCSSPYGWGVLAYSGYTTYPQGNVTVTNCTAGHLRWIPDATPPYWQRADYFLSAADTESNNNSLPADPTEADVQNAINAFEASVVSNGVPIGPLYAAAGSGWVYAAFTNPPVLTPGTQYVGCVFNGTPANFYAATHNYFSSGPGASGITNGPLTAPNSASAAHGQNVFHYGTPLTLPTDTYNASSYYVDVQVTKAS
jgi:hypothetical protein